MARRMGPRGAARHSRSNPMAIIVPVVFIVLIVIIVVLVASKTNAPGSAVEGVCGDLMEAIQQKNRNQITKFTGIGDPQVGERLANFATSHELVRYEVISSTVQGEISAVRVHIVYNPARDALVGKTTDQKIGTMTLRFRWASGRWVLESYSISES